MGRQLIGVPRVQSLAVTKSRESDEDETSDERGAVVSEAAEVAPEPDETVTTITKTEAGPGWVDKIKDAIPVEVVAAWVAIDTLLLTGETGPTGFYWAVFAVALVLTGLYMWVNIDVPDSEATWKQLATWKKRFAVGAHIVLAIGAFVVWALYLLASGSGSVDLSLPVIDYGFSLVERQAAVLLVLYTLAGPQLVPELVTKVLGVEVETVEEPGEGASS